MGKHIDLSGSVFGRLTVLKREGTRVTPNGTVRPLWKCACVCGNTVFIQTTSLKSGNTTSCGCFQRENTNRLIVSGLLLKYRLGIPLEQG